MKAYFSCFSTQEGKTMGREDASVSEEATAEMDLEE